ncbi:MAG: hypothetical protein RSB04_12395, partial [Gordonibacter sp.]|uniref:hypothetical protein n=1 Tax=Gordonibacter sp. TaxID=1968902 RepID=UPI002FCB184B
PFLTSIEMRAGAYGPSLFGDVSSICPEVMDMLRIGFLVARLFRLRGRWPGLLPAGMLCRLFEAYFRP